MSNYARQPGATAPGAAGGFIGTAIGLIVGAAIGGIIAAVIVVAKALFKLAAFALNQALKRDSSSLDEVSVEPLSESEAEEATSPQVIPDLPPDLLWSKRYEENMRKRVELGKVDVDLWFYPNLGKVSRTVRVRNRALVNKIGERMRLADLETNDLVRAEMQTIEEVEALLEAHKPKVKAKTLETKPLEEVQTKVAAVAPPETNPRKTVDTVSVAESSTAAQKPKTVEKNAQTKKLVYRGELLKFGVETHSDANGGQYSCFCIHIHDMDANAAQKIIGTDLERAIKESGAVSGDAIEVALMGETQTFNHNRRGKKKLWSVTKI